MYKRQVQHHGCVQRAGGGDGREPFGLGEQETRWQLLTGLLSYSVGDDANFRIFHFVFSLSAIAAEVARLVIRPLVLNFANRDPGTLAVMAATLHERFEEIEVPYKLWSARRSDPRSRSRPILFVLRGCTVVRLELSEPFHADGPSQQRLGMTLTHAEVRSGRDRRG